MELTGKKRGGRREPPGGAPRKGNDKLCGYVRPETRRKVLSVAGDGVIGEALDRIVAYYDAGMRARKLIAHIQALIMAHRYPDMYNVQGVIEDAEATWKEANEELLDLQVLLTPPPRSEGGREEETR